MSNPFNISLENQILLVELSRAAAYRSISDPLFFGWQRGENTEKEWLDSIQAIKAANPYPTED
jgi:hypothetical protein